MDYKRVVLYLALAFTVFSLWTSWLKDYPMNRVATTQTMTTATTNIPASPQQVSNVPSTEPTQKTATTPATPDDRTIQVNTDVLNVKIDKLGGTITQVSLPKYPAELKSNVPVAIMSDDPNNYYIAQSGLTGADGPDTQQGQVMYQAEQKVYTLQPGQNEMDVKLTWHNAKGLQLTKTFRFTRNDYAVHINYNLQNNNSKTWSGNLYNQIRKAPEPKKHFLQFSTYTGAAISSAEKPYEKLSYSKLRDENLSRNIRGGWLAVQQRYFLSAAVPNQQENNHYYSNVDDKGIYTLGYLGPVLSAAPGKAVDTTSTVYVGPELEDRLKAVAPHLDLTIDFGWLWWLSIPILWVMTQIYRVVGNWGWAIVLVTVLIKAIFYKLSEMSYRSMGKMRLLQPKLAELKQRYGDDRQKLGQATMELYRQEKVNPLGGCLPIIIQIPVFIALYYVLIESVQFRHAPFMLWIQDLSSKDPYYVLPILMGISMWVQQRLNPAPPDPVQARVMQFMPALFTVFFLTFPSGLVLYWLTNNVLSILQQWYIMRRLEKPKAKKNHPVKKKR